MYHVLFTGLGSIGRKHLTLLRELDQDFAIHAYRSGSSTKSTPDGITEYGQLRRALETNPDIAFVTNPTSLHVETAQMCAEAGCDLFIEKPISHQLEGTDTLIETAESKNLVCCVASPLRYHPVLRTVENQIDDGEIGEVLSARAYSGSYLPEWRPERDYRESYSSSRDLGGGVVLDLIHEIDYVYRLFGDVANSVGRTARVSDLDIETEDLAEIILKMDSGMVAQIHLDYVRRQPRRTLEVTGSSGSIRADFVENEVRLEQDYDDYYRDLAVDDDEMYRRQLRAFLDAVEQRNACESTLKEAQRVLKIALDVREDSW